MDTDPKYMAWYCKVGVKHDLNLPGGCDYPMRVAIQRAFKEITGVDADFTFSGWNAEITPIERRVIDNK